MSDFREHLRETFNRSADVYDRIRPGYPEALVDDVISLSRIPEQGRILEIGCGTGKATESFACRGYWMDCLDIGSDLAAVAAAKFERFKNVDIVVCSFEDWEPRNQVYDLVMAATSFHWVNPKGAYIKSVAVLKSTGALAVFSNTHVRKNEGFFASDQDVYDARAPSMARGESTKGKSRQKPVGQELFREPVVRRYSWSMSYTAEEYVELLGTYSDHINLPYPERKALFTGIAHLINGEFGGMVQKYYESVLTLRMVNR